MKNPRLAVSKTGQIAAALLLAIGVSLPAGAALAERQTEASTFTPIAFDPMILSIQEEEVTARLGQALMLVIEGHAEGALEQIEELSSESMDPEFSERLALEHERLSTWITARDAYLQYVQIQGKTISVPRKGKLHKAKILAYQDKRLKVSKSGATWTVPVENMSLENIGEKAAEHFVRRASGPLWLRLYPYSLLGNPKATEVYKRRKEAEILALQKDALDFYPDALSQGRACGPIEELARAPFKTDPESAAQTLAQIEALWGQHEGVDLIVSRRGSLQTYARVCLTSIYGGRSLEELMYAKAVSEDSGRVHLEYSFPPDSKSILLDFDRHDEYWNDVRSAWGLDTPEGTTRYIRGSFPGRGQTSYKHVLELEAPLTVKYTFRIKKNDTNSLEGTFGLGISADESGNCIFTHPSGMLVLVDTTRGMVDIDSPPKLELFAKRDYKVQLRHDGETVESYLDGKRMASASSGSRRSGRLFFFLNQSPDWIVSSLVIEGQLSKRGRRKLIERRVLQEMQGKALWN